MVSADFLSVFASLPVPEPLQFLAGTQVDSIVRLPWWLFPGTPAARLRSGLPQLLDPVLGPKANSPKCWHSTFVLRFGEFAFGPSRGTESKFTKVVGGECI